MAPTLSQCHYCSNLKMPENFFSGINSCKEPELGPWSCMSCLWLELRTMHWGSLGETVTTEREERNPWDWKTPIILFRDSSQLGVNGPPKKEGITKKADYGWGMSVYPIKMTSVTCQPPSLGPLSQASDPEEERQEQSWEVRNSLPPCSKIQKN